MLQGEPGPVGPAGATGPRGGPVSDSLLFHQCYSHQQASNNLHKTHNTIWQINRKIHIRVTHEGKGETRKSESNWNCINGRRTITSTHEFPYRRTAKYIWTINIMPCSGSLADLDFGSRLKSGNLRSPWKMVHYWGMNAGASFMKTGSWFSRGSD